MKRTICAFVILLIATRMAAAGTHANRLVYLDSADACYLGPGLAVTRWHGEPSIGQVVILDVSRVGGRIDLVQEMLGRLNAGALPDHLLRRGAASASRFRMVDLNGDGMLDMVCERDGHRETRLWSAADKRWLTGRFPAAIGPAGVRWGVVRPDGVATILIRSVAAKGAWHLVEGQWVADHRLVSGLEIDGARVLTSIGDRDRGVRLRDLDRDGCCELIVGNPSQRAVFSWSEKQGVWRRLPFALPEGAFIVDANGDDAGLRFVDLDCDGSEDVIFSDESGYGAYLFDSMETGWKHKIVAGLRSEDGQAPLPLITFRGKSTAAWFDPQRLRVRNSLELEDAAADEDEAADVLRMKLTQRCAGVMQAAAVNGFARLIKNDGGADQWYNYRGETVPNHHLRQQVAGATLEWETPPVPQAGQADTVTFVFLGAVGYQSQPRTEGYSFAVDGKDMVRFDVTRRLRHWRSADGKVVLMFRPTWTSDVDAAGFFYVSVSRDLLTPGKPLRLAVRSLGTGSARWFAIHPVTDVVPLQDYKPAASKGETPDGNS